MLKPQKLCHSNSQIQEGSIAAVDVPLKAHYHCLTIAIHNRLSYLMILALEGSYFCL